MKKIITLLLVVTATTFIASAQLLLDKKLEMTGGSNADRQITNVGDPTGASDAVNARTVQEGALVYASATGSGNAYVITIIPSPAAYTTGMIVNFKANHTNTGAATLKVGTLAPISIKTGVTNNLSAGEILNNQMVSVMYDGSHFQLLSRGIAPVTLPPSGPAGGDLTGSYPNPDIATGVVTTDEIANGTITAADIANTGVGAGGYNNLTVNAQGQVTGGSNVAYLTTEADGSITNEGSLSVGAGLSNTSLIQSNTSGSGTVTLIAGNGMTLSESGNDITIAATPTIYAAGTGIGISGGTITNTAPSLWTESGSNLYPNSLAWNTGIGTATPVQKLEVNGRTVFHNGGATYTNASAAEVQIGYAIASSGSVGEVARLALQPYGHTGGPFLFFNRDNASSAYLDIRYGTSNLISILHDGNTGLGTQSPAGKLDVRGNTLIGDGTVFGDSRLSIGGTNGYNDAALTMRSGSGSGPVFSVLPWSSQVYISAGVYYSDGSWVHYSDDGNNVLFTLDPGEGTYWYASNNSAGSWNVASGISLWDYAGHWKSTVQSTRTGNSYFTGGNLGVGTSSPGYKLHVQGAIGGNTAYLPGYSNWANLGTGDGGAAIYNDNDGYKRLMIVGNNSGGGNRHVGLWDDVTVSSNLTVGGLAGSSTRMVAANSSGTLVPASIDARSVLSYQVSGMAVGKRYLVCVYGITANRGNDNNYLNYMYVADCNTGTWLAYTPLAYINWPDGHAPHSHCFVITVPAGGCVNGYTDNGLALHMTAVQLD